MRRYEALRDNTPLAYLQELALFHSLIVTIELAALTPFPSPSADVEFREFSLFLADAFGDPRCGI